MAESKKSSSSSSSSSYSYSFSDKFGSSSSSSKYSTSNGFPFSGIKNNNFPGKNGSTSNFNSTENNKYSKTEVKIEEKFRNINISNCNNISFGNTIIIHGYGKPSRSSYEQKSSEKSQKEKDSTKRSSSKF